MNMISEPEDVIIVTAAFLAVEKDDSKQKLIMDIACELLDISQDKLMEMLPK